MLPQNGFHESLDQRQNGCHEGQLQKVGKTVIGIGKNSDNIGSLDVAVTIQEALKVLVPNAYNIPAVYSGQFPLDGLSYVMVSIDLFFEKSAFLSWDDKGKKAKNVVMQRCPYELTPVF